uniref:Uncharacterized protein n=1 Tax=Arundo donax TaxID=35708 RepID=A0A0A8Y1C5_ARUDO
MSSSSTRPTSRERSQRTWSSQITRSNELAREKC